MSKYSDLYSDNSHTNVGSSHWQVQRGKANFTGYASKTLPSACQKYRVTELEMTGFLISISLWNHLLSHTDFDCSVYHLAVI